MRYWSLLLCVLSLAVAGCQVKQPAGRPGLVFDDPVSTVQPSLLPEDSEPGLYVGPSEQEIAGEEEVTIQGSSALLVLYAGQQPTGGYRMGLESIQKNGDVFTIKARLHTPPKTGMVTQVLTDPVLIIPFTIKKRGVYRIKLSSKKNFAQRNTVVIKAP